MYQTNEVYLYLFSLKNNIFTPEVPKSGRTLQLWGQLWILKRSDGGKRQEKERRVITGKGDSSGGNCMFDPKIL